VGNELSSIDSRLSWAPSWRAFAVAVGLTGLILLFGFAELSHNYMVFVVAAGVTLPFFWLFRPMSLIYCFLFLIPLWPKLPLVPMRGFLVSIRLEDFCIVAFLAVVLLRRVFRPGTGLPLDFLKPVLVFLFCCALSTAFGVAILGSVDTETGFLFFFRLVEYFSVALISFALIRNHADLDKLIVALAAACLAVDAYAMLQEFGLVPVFNASHMSGDLVLVYFLTEGFGSDRLAATFAGAVDLAGFYVVVMPTFLLLALEETISSFARAAYFFLFALSLLCMYLTYSRGALVGLALGLGMALWLTGRRRLTMALVPLAIVPALFLEGFADRLNELLDFGSQAPSLTSRFQESWVPAWHSFMRSPFIGTGLGSLRGEGIGIDGFYVFILGMTGIVGLVAFLWVVRIVLTTLYLLFRDVNSSPMVRIFACGIFASTVGLLINAVFTDVFTLSKVAEIYWFLIGALFAAEGFSRRSPRVVSNLVRTGTTI